LPPPGSRIGVVAGEASTLCPAGAGQRQGAQLGSQFGVSERVNYCKKRGKSLEKVAGVFIPPARRLTHLPFQHLNKPGWAYDTLLVEPPIFLEKLRNDLRPHVPFRQRRFTSHSDIFGSLVEPIIVNCAVLASKALVNDTMMVPITGQLALVKPQPRSTYLYRIIWSPRCQPFMDIVLNLLSCYDGSIGQCQTVPCIGDKWSERGHLRFLTEAVGVCQNDVQGRIIGINLCVLRIKVFDSKDVLTFTLRSRKRFGRERMVGLPKPFVRSVICIVACFGDDKI
jgi:hypothetical protein